MSLTPAVSFWRLYLWTAKIWYALPSWKKANRTRPSFTALTKTGFGKDIWTISSFDQVDNFLFLFFVFECLYVVTLGMIRMSICFMYLRLFPNVHRFRQWVWGTQAVNAAFTIAFLAAALAQCRPMSTFWKNWDGEHPGQCVNIDAMVWSHAGINIALDLWMLALPASQVWELHMALRQKIRLMIMFGLGLL